MPRHSEGNLAAIKQAVDIVALVGDYLPLHRHGSKYKALCPFHDDHNPSLIIDPEHQSFKCWSCGAGGDIFTFVKDYERVEFPEALRMLADRAGVTLDHPTDRSPTQGPSKTDLLDVCAWAERQFTEALAAAPEALAYAERRGIDGPTAARFRLGYAPEARDWLSLKARRDGVASALLEGAGLIARNPDSPGLTRDRFRGRLIFPIHDLRGRPIAFGGRILPDSEQKLADAGLRVAKYLNSPETVLFQKRRNLYAADLARTPARQAGWIAVVEGYTDVIAAHQVGLANVVGTLGTALGDDHVLALRRLADRVVLVFDGDEAGQNAADRSLELFLGHEVDIRVISLPDGLDPCDFLLKQGADAFRSLVDHAVDPLVFAIDRAASRFDFDAVDGARQAAEWVLAILARVPKSQHAGLDLKVAKALDTLSDRLRLPIVDLKRLLNSSRKPAARPKLAAARPESAPILSSTAEGEPAEAAPVSVVRTIRASELNPLDRELIEILLSEPTAVVSLITRVAVGSLRDAPLRAILQACYDLHGEGRVPSFDRVAPRLDGATRSLAAGLLLPIESGPLSDRARPGSWADRLAEALASLAERDRQDRLRDLKGALGEVDRAADPDEYRALNQEYLRLLNQRPDTRKKTAS